MKLDWIYNLIYGKKDAEIEALKEKIQNYAKINQAALSLYNDAIKEKDKLIFENIGKMNIPNITPLLKDTNTIDPRVLLAKDSFIADEIYTTLPSDGWKPILSTVRAMFQASWTSEVFDCDNFAVLMNSLVQYVNYKNGGKRALAFGYAYSDTHAYNFFIDVNGLVWIYEPQDGRVIGLIGRTPKPYNTVMTYMLG